MTDDINTVDVHIAPFAEWKRLDNGDWQIPTSLGTVYLRRDQYPYDVVQEAHALLERLRAEGNGQTVAAALLADLLGEQSDTGEQ